MKHSSPLHRPVGSENQFCLKRSPILRLLSFLLLTALFFACQKDDTGNPNTNPNTGNNTPDCERLHRGSFQLSNNNPSPYKIEMNGENWGTVNGNTTELFRDKTSKTYSFKATQISGYLFYPTVYTKTVDIYDCQTTSLEINP